jgi:hypothetical protein
MHNFVFIGFSSLDGVNINSYSGVLHGAKIGLGVVISYILSGTSSRGVLLLSWCLYSTANTKASNTLGISMKNFLLHNKSPKITIGCSTRS